MTPTEHLRQNLQTRQRELEQAQRELQILERNCVHVWGATIPDHVYHEGYTDPGDPVGTMGVDWRGPVYVAGRTEKRWKRKCSLCGKEETTTRVNTETIVKETPRF